MPTETLSPEERAVERAQQGVPAREDDSQRLLARHREQVRKFKVTLSVYVLALLVLVPVWAVDQYETSPGWPKHLSSRSRYPGDWDPWIIWVALVGAVVVAVAGYRAYASRPQGESDDPLL